MNSVVAFWGIGSGADPAHRNIGWDIAIRGWSQFVESQIKPAIDLGYTRFHLHNPGGSVLGLPMQADQFMLCGEKGLVSVLKDFVKAWKPITAKFEVIAYLGTLSGTPTFINLKTQKKPKDYLKRLYDSYSLPLDAGMSIGFDALYDAPPISAEYSFLRFLQSFGVRTYIEPWPQITQPQYWDCNHVSTVQLINHMQRIDGSWAAPKDKLTGECLVIMNEPPQGHTWSDYNDWCPDWMRSMWAQNFIPCIAPRLDKKLSDWILTTPATD